MKEVVKEAGLQSDGELVQAKADLFDFVTPRAPAGLILPAVQAVREAAAVDQSDRDGTPVAGTSRGEGGPARAKGDDDGLPPTLDWGIDGDGPGDQGHDDWIDIITMSPPPPTRTTQADDDHRGWINILSTGGGASGVLEESLSAPLLWDIG